MLKALMKRANIEIPTESSLSADIPNIDELIEKIMTPRGEDDDNTS